MDRRQRKSREAIFAAFIDLLSQKDFGQITVGEIIARADVGRATFYAHFETKDFLLKALSEELFCHVFEAANGEAGEHRLFHCDAPSSVFLHLLQHLQKNDNHVLALLSGRNNELFLQYFKSGLRDLVKNQLPLFEHRRSKKLPLDFWVDHICAVFVETVRWWVAGGMTESPETVAEYFSLAV